MDTTIAEIHNDRLYVRGIIEAEPGAMPRLSIPQSDLILNLHTGRIEKSRFRCANPVLNSFSREIERQVLQRILETAPNDFLITDALWGASHALLELRKLTNA